MNNSSQSDERINRAGIAYEQFVNDMKELAVYGKHEMTAILREGELAKVQHIKDGIRTQ